MNSIFRVSSLSLRCPLRRVAIYALMLLLLLGFPAFSSAETVRLFFDSGSPQISFAAGDIKAALEKHNHTVQTAGLSTLKEGDSGKKIILAVATDNATAAMLVDQGGKAIPDLGAQAYALRTTASPELGYWVLGGDATGAMYGGLQIAENISDSGLQGAYDSEESPFLRNRGMKLNLPLDKRIPTYVGGWSSNSAKEAIPHVWDMEFWKTLIDQQARNRYNVLSIWVHHPFPALVKLPDYPKVCLPRIEGFDGFVKEWDHDQRVAFWRGVMRHAHDRGMKFYFFNWNIHLEHASDQYPNLTEDPGNRTTIDYMSKSMRALLETYPDLDGFGITSGDGMDGTNEENTQWTWDVVGKAVLEYMKENPSRKFNLIHRGVKTNPETCDGIYAPIKSLSNVTFNMSAKYAMAHMYSTPTPRWTGDIDSCHKLGLQTWLTFRNDDYFYLNWGDPKFVRDFMAGIPRVDTTVVGMYIGIDGYNPSRTYFHKHEVLNGQLEVERRWYMEMLWGRMSYNPRTSDDVLRRLLAARYPRVPTNDLFDAWSLASRSLPKVTELVMKKWSLDFHWYPEGCWSDPGRCTGFRTIGGPDGFAGPTSVANGSDLADIAASAAGQTNGKKSSYTVADEMQADATKALALVNPLESGGDAHSEVAINNVKQMAYLSIYYAHKVRGATFNKAGKIELAREQMGRAYCAWMIYSRSMEETYLPDSFRNLGIAPDWKYADAAVLKEYTDLGGEGIPECENMFTLATNATDGAIEIEPSGGVYTKGKLLRLTAVPHFGHAFADWGGDLSGSSNPATLTMDSKKKVTANFIVSAGDAAPWFETFSVFDGTQSHGGPTSWTAKRAGGSFEVRGSRLMINKGGGEGVFETGDILIPNGSVKVSLDVQPDGGLDSGDFVQFFKVVDGGAPEPVGARIVGRLTRAQTLVGTNITGSRLRLRIVTEVSASDEFYYFDNLKVVYELEDSTQQAK